MSVWGTARGVAVLLATTCLPSLQAQQVLPVSALSSGSSRLALVNPLFSAERPSEASSKRLWRISLVTLSVANALDVHSSLGKHELNSTLASPSGTLGTQGVLIKSALQGGLMGIEYLVTRSHSSGSLVARPRSKLYRTLAIINFASTGVITGIAIHNYTVPRER